MIKKTALCLAIFIITGISSAFAVEFSADMVTDIQSGGVTGKLYFKNNEVSRNEMMGMITILKRPMVYQIFRDSKKYYVTNVDELKKKNPLAEATDLKTWVERNNMKKVGRESIGGFTCDIYEGDVQFDEENRQSAHMKIWLSEKLNYSLKTEVTLPPPVGKMSSHLENIKIGKQPDHLFEVPSGYTKAATMNEALGIPDMGSFMQGGRKNNGADQPSAGQMPSQEQMNEMMKKMQEMMKQN